MLNLISGKSGNKVVANKSWFTVILIKCIYETNYRYMQQIFGDTSIILLTISQWD